jgi:uncharacterized membrane protein HdeD (DUF308 family)
MADAGMMYSGNVLKDWWARLIIGIILVFFGFVAYVWTGPVLTTLIVLFGGLCLFMGVVLIIASLSGAIWPKHSVLILFEGVLLFIIGIMAFFWTDITAKSLAVIFGFFAVLVGVFRIAEVFTMPKELKTFMGRTSLIFLLVAGIFSLIIGLFLLLFPVDSLLAILWAAGLYAILFGIMLIASALAGSKK